LEELVFGQDLPIVPIIPLVSAAPRQVLPVEFRTWRRLDV
jgi:hypothetical protein